MSGLRYQVLPVRIEYLQCEALLNLLQFLLQVTSVHINTVTIFGMLVRQYQRVVDLQALIKFSNVSFQVYQFVLNFQNTTGFTPIVDESTLNTSHAYDCSFVNPSVNPATSMPLNSALLSTFLSSLPLESVAAFAVT